MSAMPPIPAWRDNEALTDTPGALVSPNELSVAGQADDVVLVASHRVSLSHPRDVRERLGFIRAPSIGYVNLRVNLRPLGLGFRALSGRITPGIKSGTGIGKVAIDPERRA
jgi:hypothetical protein